MNWRNDKCEIAFTFLCQVTCYIYGRYSAYNRLHFGKVVENLTIVVSLTINNTHPILNVIFVLEGKYDKHFFEIKVVKYDTKYNCLLTSKIHCITLNKLLKYILMIELSNGN